MLNWLYSNIGSIIVVLCLVVLISSIVIHLVKNKKQGKSSCSCGCGGCPMSDSCHGKNK